MKSLAQGQAKCWAKKDSDKINLYWSSTDGIIRSKWFAEQINKYKFSSIFEVGFFSGRNLYYIGEKFPNVSLSGIDINKTAVKFARTKIPKADLLYMDLHDMHNIDKKFDIVFTSGVLIHVPPENIKDVILKCIKLSNKYIMHIENLGNNVIDSGPKSLNPAKVSGQLQWRPDIISIYKNLGYNVRSMELPEECKPGGVSHLLIINRMEQ